MPTIDDAFRMQPEFCCEHDVDDGLGAVVYALEIDVDDALELLVGHLAEASVLHDARIVDQRVDALPREHHAFDHARDARLVGDVHLESERVAAVVANFGQRFRDRGHVDVADGDLGAFLGELDRGGAADTLTSAGNDGDLAGQPPVSIAVQSVAI